MRRTILHGLLTVAAGTWLTIDCLDRTPTLSWSELESITGGHGGQTKVTRTCWDFSGLNPCFGLSEGDDCTTCQSNTIEDLGEPAVGDTGYLEEGNPNVPAQSCGVKWAGTCGLNATNGLTCNRLPGGGLDGENNSCSNSVTIKPQHTPGPGDVPPGSGD